MTGPGSRPGLELASLPNLRDVGGHPTQGGGRVRRGLLYRSTDLARLDDAGLLALERLGLRTVFDLRTAGERTASPDRLPAGAEHVVVDVLRDAEGFTPTGLEGILASPGAAERLLGGGRAERFFVDAYRELVELPSAREGYGRLFRELATPERRPALVHCTTGKDRTGWATAALLLFLGVAAEIVTEEYLRSGPVMEALFAPHLAAFVARGGDPGLLRPLVGVDAAYLASALEAVQATWGSMDRYVADGLGLDAATRAALREAFVEPD